MRHRHTYKEYYDYEVFRDQKPEVRLDMDDFELYWRDDPNRIASLAHASKVRSTNLTLTRMTEVSSRV